MNNVKPTTTSNVVNAIVSLRNSFHQGKFPLLLSSEEIDKLLLIVKNRNIFEWDQKGYRLYNLFVALCSHPWNVDKSLAKHGLCYHGNFGELPSLFQGLQLIIRNVESSAGENPFA